MPIINEKDWNKLIKHLNSKDKEIKHLRYVENNMFQNYLKLESECEKLKSRIAELEGKLQRVGQWVPLR
jgi:predicted nuclease with TOPRIM domain